MTRVETYAESVAYLEDLYHRPIIRRENVGLQRVQHVLHRLGNPERAFRSVHITGTNGKGSTATMVGSVLSRAGYRTGMFRSPHLQSYRERIAVDDELIPESGWLGVFREVLPIAEEMEHTAELGRPSLFEYVWAMAALHFARQGVDFGVVEVGIGGRLSATNVVQPDVAVVTNVSLDHMAQLGPTEADIAREKAGIIKPGCAAATAADREDVLDVIRARCAETGAPLSVVGEDVTLRIRRASTSGQIVDFRVGDLDLQGVRLRMLGAHQALNAATAVAVAEALRRREVHLPVDAVRAGLEAAHFPGRFEIVRQQPTIVLDGAHNAGAAAVLRNTLDAIFPGRPITLLIGVLGDKDARAVVGAVGPRAARAVVTVPPWTERAGTSDRVASLLADYTHNVERIDSPMDALRHVLAAAQASDLVVITGSLYLVGALRPLLVPDDATSTGAAQIPTVVAQ